MNPGVEASLSKNISKLRVLFSNKKSDSLSPTILSLLIPNKLVLIRLTWVITTVPVQ
jgi:hypothetical protein